MKKILMTTAMIAAFAASALAAGEGSGGSGTSTSGTTMTKPVSPKAKKCKRGEVVKSVKKNGMSEKSCVKASASIISDDELYDQGRALAKEGEYDWALQVLALIQDQNQPRVLNYTGYSHRKAGRLETGVAYYQKALALNPNFVLAREYLGEGYVAAGRIDLAKGQLQEIAKRCGTNCEEYVDLNKAITDAEI